MTLRRCLLSQASLNWQSRGTQIWKSGQDRNRSFYFTEIAPVQCRGKSGKCERFFDADLYNRVTSPDGVHSMVTKEAET